MLFELSMFQCFTTDAVMFRAFFSRNINPLTSFYAVFDSPQHSETILMECILCSLTLSHIEVKFMVLLQAHLHDNVSIGI